ncbi:ornithine cyclodeaminase family protein [Terrihalobacillus insolitus]|uniref:ornithine cyclodeaminase family protein n=1 Tax=Terrihalobacillus insolitus TaxID=2950438 RepID=UPI002341A35B|nr:ornithine cyclodeaminase family protein [Terrihalobacillus insolitus]MDC3414777.1 ornithine cyclodeaminase family protein [Terrihalobacillus insolitus]
MRVITEEHIHSFYTMKNSIDAVEKALKIQQEGNSMSPIRNQLYIEETNGNFLSMPSFVGELKEVGIKLTTIFPGNTKHGKRALRSVFVLMDGTTGDYKALIDFSLLTVFRTGALSGVATKYLARENADSCLVIGCGEQAKGQILAIIEVRELKRIYLYNRSIEKALILKDYLQNEIGWDGDIEIVDNPDNYLGQTDIIICSTSSSQPVFNGKILKDGTHINGIGSYMPHMQEVDIDTLKRSEKIVVDTLGGTLEEAGDFIIPKNRGEWDPKEIYGELGELVLGRKGGRETESEITFFKSVGFSTLDIVVASEIYKMAKAKNIGRHIEF